MSDPSLLMPSNVTITPAQSARNLFVIFESTLSMCDHISSVSRFVRVVLFNSTYRKQSLKIFVTNIIISLAFSIEDTLTITICRKLAVWLYSSRNAAL